MNNGTKTILILTPGFAKNEADSSCLPFQQVFLRTFRTMFPSHQVIIVSFQYPYEKGSYQWHGMKVISMGRKEKGGLHRLLLWQRTRMQIKRVIAENNIIAVMSFWCGECALIGKRFASSHQVPWFCWIPGQDAKKENSYVKRI